MKKAERNEKLDGLLDEADQIARILGSIIINAKKGKGQNEE